ncbi:MAG: 30S ribosomal protein S18 [Proteobacteria bacterium]|nr:30S ribosomal protein S18 [Pseudomonadota bacterium]
MAFDREQREPRGDRGEGRGDRGEGRGAGAGGAPFFRRKKTCPFSGDNAPKIDWKDVKMLTRYISERGKIMPSRITAVSAAKQRELAIAIKRARFMALMPYVRDELPPQRSFGDRPERGSYGDRDRGPRTDRSFSSFENTKEG